MAKLKKKDIWLEQFQLGYGMVERHPIFGPLLRYVHVSPVENAQMKGAAHCGDHGYITVSRKMRLAPEEWAYVLAHCLLHYGLWHFEQKADPVKWNVACDMYIAKFLADAKLFRAPEFMSTQPPYPAESEEELYRRMRDITLIDEMHGGFSTGNGFTDFELAAQGGPRYYRRGTNAKQHYTNIFADALTNAVSAAVGVAAGQLTSIADREGLAATPAEKARRWFISSYPLLGALAAGFKIMEDPDICRREEISTAAISEATQTIFISPGAGLTQEECRFVMAHEFLHVGLRHQSRCQGRDPYLWNVACDYVINGWLTQMGVGEMPKMELLYDPDFSGMSAETIYDMIVKDIRRFKKLATLRGKGLSDILGEGDIRFYKAPVGLDDFYRRAITEGLEYHKAGRGLVPAGLEEEIQALYRDPIPWDVELARWFDNFFSPIEKKRTYARASRRQSSTPDIVRPRTVPDSDALEGRTFGVVIDTSGSMDRYMLAVALGSVTSYADSRDVPYARVIFCDAAAYDAGYLAPDAIMGRIQVQGRGGTVLQPGIDFLEKAPDFPKNGPVLIITDAYCDHFTCHRDHAILIPKGAKLPFRPGGPVFVFE